MAYSMIGKRNLPPKPTPKVVAPTRAEVKQQTTLKPNSPEQISAMNRVKRLTTKADEWSPHDTHMQYVHDTLNHGVNALEDRGDVSNDVIARMYGKLHQASLHLNQHARSHNKNDYGDAAAHLEIAAKHLSEVGSTLNNHLGATVTHAGDKQTYPVSFMKTHATTLANDYRNRVAGIPGQTAQVPGRDYEPENALQIPEFKSGKAEDNTSFHMTGRIPAGYSLKDDSNPSTRVLTKEQFVKGPTNTVTSRDSSPAEEKLAGMAPIMTRRDHVLKAHDDLINKGKMHSSQMAALPESDIIKLHEMTGVALPKKYQKAAGTNIPSTQMTPMPRDREF